MEILEEDCNEIIHKSESIISDDFSIDEAINRKIIVSILILLYISLII